MSLSEFLLSDWDETIREIVGAGGEFRMYPKGTSMLPLLRERVDSVSVSAPVFPLKKGTMLFYQRDNGQYVLHRVQGQSKDGTYFLCGDHQMAVESGVREDMAIAVVSRVFRNDKELPLNSCRYRVYRFLILFSTVRKVLLFRERICLRLRRLLHKNTH